MSFLERKGLFTSRFSLIASIFDRVMKAHNLYDSLRIWQICMRLTVSYRVNNRETVGPGK